MISRYFIDRPIFATVIAIVIVISGGVTVLMLPVAQYPEISPPTVEVRATYPGANARVIADTVAQPIEEQVNGVEDMLYMSSTSSNDGSYRLMVTFTVGTDIDMATDLVQNRVAIAEPLLPQEVIRQGVTTRKRSTDIVMFIVLTSPDRRFDELFLSNYATLRLKDELARVDGVGDLMIFGASDYSMRVWLDPEKLKARNLTTNDVVAAIEEQNVQVAAGRIGQPPAPPGQSFQYTVNTLGRLEDVAQFEDIIVKTATGGRITRVKDVARVELGSKSYDSSSQYRGRACAAIGIFRLPNANVLDVVDGVRAKMDVLSAAFPDGLDYAVPFDTTKFVRASIREVVVTIFIAGGLVFITLFVFLQNWRATLIPSVAIPVSLIGTFIVMAALGFSINMLTLFGLVLAIGIVVDDAIVVVENASRHINESGLHPRAAAIKAMGEVTGPIVATTLVLLAVFIPAAFLGGVTGQLYRQFALTIATATAFSSINALTMSPALCALVLRRTPSRRSFFVRSFNWTYSKGSKIYEHIVGGMVRRAAISMAAFLVIAGLTYWGFMSLPTEFLPAEDQGYALITAQLPDAASLERTRDVVKAVDDVLGETDGVEAWVSVPGYSLLDGTTSSNAATFWVILEPWDDRADSALSANSIVSRLSMQLAGTQEAKLFAFVPPAIMGLGQTGGFQMQLQDRGGVGYGTLQQLADEIVSDANVQPSISGVYTTFRANVPQLYADIDRVKAKTLDVPLTTIFNTLQAYLGSTYVNDFNKFGRTYQVRVQAEPRFRARQGDIKQLEVRNSQREMIPLGTLVGLTASLGPQVITRYNVYPSASIFGSAAGGRSSGDALATMEDLAGTQLPNSMGFEWTGMSYQEKATGGQAAFVFVLAVVFVYLVLAAQYESWSLPWAVILAVPLALVGATIAVAVREMAITVYTQIGIVLLVALASKNAILIVEFARAIRARDGDSAADAAIEAARLRFRPILMTAFTFILGVIPLVIARGAGAASRQSLGTAVFGGMIAATVLAVVFAPTFFVVVEKVTDRVRRRRKLVADTT